MSDVSASWTFSCPDPTYDCAYVLTRGSTRVIVSSIALLLLSFIFLSSLFLFVTPACAANESDSFRPEVLVLVLGGFGSAEQCSISYSSVVELPKAQTDLDTIAAAGAWQVRDAKGITKSSGGPKPVATTSTTFAAQGLIDYANGTFPLEPFLIGLKRFKFIELDYIAPTGFVFRGLEEFENNFVKIQLRQSGNSYRYRVVVKDAGFDKLDLPLRQPERARAEEAGISGGMRIAIAVLIALLAAVLVYLTMSFVSRRRR